MIFTDGACCGNPGPGGWGGIILDPQARVRELGGAEARTTNNRMELSAVIAALKAVAPQNPRRADLYTDSSYVILGATKWLAAWKRRGWVSLGGRTVLNRDLWEQVDAVVLKISPERVRWHYVRGHSGFPGNERCDLIAVSFARGKPESLYSGPLAAYPCDLADLPQDAGVPRSAGGGPKKNSGGIYLSFMNGKLERHSLWSECRARVHGKSGAKFKKVHSQLEEAQTLKSWGLAS